MPMDEKSIFPEVAQLEHTFSPRMRTRCRCRSSCKVASNQTFHVIIRNFLPGRPRSEATAFHVEVRTSAELSGFQSPMNDIPGKVAEKRYSGMRMDKVDMSFSKIKLCRITQAHSRCRATRIIQIGTVNAPFKLFTAPRRPSSPTQTKFGGLWSIQCMYSVKIFRNLVAVRP
jgi:hypothetical protein